MNTRQRNYQRKSGIPRFSQKKSATLIAAGFITGAAFVVMGIFGVYKALGKSDFFQITTIRINGCEKTSKRQILELSGVDIHTNLFSLDGNKVKARVEGGQWIRKAEINKHWPNRLDITIKEYSPVAMVNLDGTLLYVDRGGDVFAEALPPGDMDYPIITGVSGTVSDEHYKEKPFHKEKALLEALRFIKYASQGNLNLPVQNISEINVSNLEDAVLFLADRPFPIHLGEMGKGMKTKYSRLVRVLSWLYKQKKFASTEFINIGYKNEKILVGQTTL